LTRKQGVSWVFELHEIFENETRSDSFLMIGKNIFATVLENFEFFAAFLQR
jgi:hypothetical protein